mgnify:CR=1 FL=1
MFKISEEEFLVVVKDARYEMYGNPRNLRHHLIRQIIRREGGISDTVPNGTYNVTVRFVGFNKVLFDMHPKQ